MTSGPPERYWTADSIQQLVEHLDLHHDCGMQDWAFEVADPDRIAEFMAAFANFPDAPDVRYTLMDVLIQSFEDLQADLRTKANWQTLIGWLEDDFETHAYQVWYWSAFGDSLDDAWRVSELMREIWARNGSEYETEDR